MIHYHGTPLGGKRSELVSFFRGRSALVPFPRPEDLPIVADVCRSFAFDNGAFTAWKSGEPLVVEGYVRWCEEWHRHPGFDWAIIPDVVDGSESDNDRMIRDWPQHIAGVPVWHMHETLDRLDLLCRDFARVAIGSSGAWPTPGRRGWWDRMIDAMGVACDENGRPRCKLHGLRMLSTEILRSSRSLRRIVRTSLRTAN